MKVVIDTNVLLVANGQHDQVSDDCVITCINRLQSLQRSGVVVIDDGYRIVGEYHHKTSLKPAKGVGDKFLKWMLQHSGTLKVEQVAINEVDDNCYAEFPDPALEQLFDASDRKFAAVAHAHPDKPTIWQAADCKWLDWWPALRAKGVEVDFLCPDDVCTVYGKKFPQKPAPQLPG